MVGAFEALGRLLHSETLMRDFIPSALERTLGPQIIFGAQGPQGLGGLKKGNVHHQFVVPQISPAKGQTSPFRIHPLFYSLCHITEWNRSGLSAQVTCKVALDGTARFKKGGTDGETGLFWS